MTLAFPRSSALVCAPAYFPPGAAAVATLGRQTCRWPLGEVEADDFRFCNAPCQRGRYCADHRRLSLRRSR